MDKSQAGMLLAYVRSIQGGEVTRLDIEAWHDVLGHLDYEDARVAARAHAVESVEYMKPAHIIQRVKQVRRAVEGGTMSPRREDCRTAGQLHRWLNDDTCMHCEVRAWELTGSET